MAADPDNMGRTERVAIVTGSSRGLGREIARKLASQGYAVIVNYFGDKPAADATVEEILGSSGTALAVRADVADELDVERLFSETVEAFGGVDVVVHAAGQIGTAAVANHDLDALEAAHRISMRGTLVLNQQAARGLRDGGAIVNFSSSCSGDGLARSAACAANRGAVETITRLLSGELRERGVTVNAIEPVPDRSIACAEIADRPIEPVPDRSIACAEIVNVVAFLIAPDGRWVNGQVIAGRVAGG